LEKKPETTEFRTIGKKGLGDLTNNDKEDEGIPEIDISEGLKQIEEQKKKFEEGLKKINNQLDTLTNIAVDMGNELDKQKELLETIDQDVNKYNAKLGKLNERMDLALQKAGGSTRMIIVVIGMIICLVLLVVLYIVFEVYIAPYINSLNP